MTDLIALAAVPVLLAAACALANGTFGRHHGHHQAPAQPHFHGAGRRDPFPAQPDDPAWPAQLHHTPCWEPVQPHTGPLPAAMQDDNAATPWKYETGEWPLYQEMGAHHASTQE